jgi:hypothetical protein
VSALLAVQQGLDVKVIAPGTNLADPAPLLWHEASLGRETPVTDNYEVRSLERFCAM